MNNITSFWWVNQGQSYLDERDGGYLWAPQRNKQGRELAHHVRLLDPKVGDIVFCYSKLEVKSVGIVSSTAVEASKSTEVSHDWNEEGYKVELIYYDLQPPIKKNEIPESWRLEEKDGPFDKNGDLLQGYFFNLSINFSKQLFNSFSERFNSEIRTKMMEYKLEGENDIVAENRNQNDPKRDIVEHIYDYIRGKGFYYHKEDVINLYLSLISKPFVILSGISGTGKTKMVQWFSESIGAIEENGRFTLIPVRPDWSDSSDLLGYVDIKGDFKEGPLTKVIKSADQNPGVPYFVLLDEMNLARVEYYFSDILSIMESRKWEDDKVVSSHLLTKETAGFDLKLPNNLYIIGTVNMDETTYPFSKKMLDRANTIEFNSIDLGNLDFLNETKVNNPLKVANDTFASKFLHLKDAYPNNEEIIGQVIRELVRMNEILEIDHSHVGYRVRDEICFYMIHNDKAKLLDFDTAFDYCILQKVLPRISGRDGLVEQLLRELYEMFTNTKFDEELDLQEVDVSFAKYPRSAQKVLEMYRRLNDGYTSFWIS